MTLAAGILLALVASALVSIGLMAWDRKFDDPEDEGRLIEGWRR